MDVGIEVRSMVEDVFQEIDQPEQPLEERLQDIVMDAFNVVNDLQEGGGESGDEEDEEPMGDLGNADDTYGDPHDLEEAIQDCMMAQSPQC